MRRFLILLLVFALPLGAAPITLRVDATDAPSNVFHSHLTIPASAGPLTLYYPKWIPGEHMPSGPIVGLAGMRVTANGNAIPWTRDPVEMFAFHVNVPSGVSVIEIDLDYLAPAGGARFTAGATTSPRLAVLSWNTVLLYPQTANTDTLQYEATLRIPRGWKYASPLETRSAGEEIRFETVSLTTL